MTKLRGENLQKIKAIEIRKEEEVNLNGTMKDSTKTDTVFEKLVDLNNGVVGLIGATIRHIIYVEDHLRHPSSN